MTTPDGAATDVREVPEPARRLVAVLLVLLVVPGVVGFDLWPLNGWRMFSLSRDETHERWVVHARVAGGEGVTVSLEELPLGYRHAEWAMLDLDEASPGRQADVCQALADAVGDVRPDTVGVDIAFDTQTMVEHDGEWVVTHDPLVVVTCAPGERDG